MAAVRRDTFSWAASIAKTLFQTGRVAQEYEINEMQDNLRVRAAKTVRGIFGSEDGVLRGDAELLVTAGGVNQITVSAGAAVVNGYFVEFAAPTTITGLSTPGGARTDYLYIEVTEQEIADPSPDPVLGVQSYRRQIVATLKVIEGATVPASGDPWSGGAATFKIASIARTASATVSLGTVTHFGKSTPYDQLKNYIFDGYDRTVTGLKAGSEGRVRAVATALKFKDTYVTSDVAFGDAIDATVTTLKNALASTTTGLVRMVQGRAFLTVGDGVKTFGDYNGDAGLEAAITAINVFQAAFPAYPVTLHVKGGTYVRQNVALTPFLGPVRVIGDGKGSSTRATIIQSAAVGALAALDCSTVNAFLQLENLQLEANTGAAGTFSVFANGSRVSGDNVTFAGQTNVVVMARVDGTQGYSFRRCGFSTWEAQPPVLLRTPNLVATPLCGFDFSECTIDPGGLVTPAVEVNDANSRGPGGTSFPWIRFSRCFIKAGQCSATPAHNNSIFKLTQTAHIEHLVYENCFIRTAELGGAGHSVLLRLRTGRSADNTTDVQNRVSRLTFTGCFFKATDTTDIAGAFRVEVVPVAAAFDNSMTLVMHDNVFQLDGQYGLDSAVEDGANEGAIVNLKATYMDIRGLTIDKLSSTPLAAAPASPANWYQAVLGISPRLSNVTPFMPPSAVVSGVFFRSLQTGGVGSPWSVVSLRPMTKGSISFHGMSINSTGLVMTAGAWGTGAIIAVSDASSDVSTHVSECSIDTDHNCYGVYVYSGAYATVTRCRANVSTTAGGDAFRSVTKTANGVNRVCFVGNFSRSSYRGIHMGVYHGEARGNTIVGAANYGIYGNCTYSVITDNEVSGCNGGGAGAAQIYVPGGVTRSTIMGNNCKDASTTALGAIKVAAPAAMTFIGCDTGTLGTFTNGANMSFNTATLETP